MEPDIDLMISEVERRIRRAEDIDNLPMLEVLYPLLNELQARRRAKCA